MNSKRFPYALVLAGTLGLFLYPRILPSSAPAYLRSDLYVTIVYLVSLAIQISGVVLLKKRKTQRPAI